VKHDNYEVEYAQGLKIYEQAVDKGEADLMSMGFPPAQRPHVGGTLADRPTLPMNLGDLSMQELQNLLGYFTAWHSYAIELVPRALSERNAADSSKAFSWAKTRKSKEGTVQDKNDDTQTDGRYIEANAYYETCECKYRKLKAVEDGLLREIETISRAQTGLERRQESDGHQGAGEHKGRSNTGPSFTTVSKQNVMARFRAKRRI
jgi:hypothetical protein